jgi:hypothetical protein
MTNSPDWSRVEKRLIAIGLSAISRFVAEHPNDLCSFFAFYSQPDVGLFGVCLDTYKNAIQAAIKNERQTFGRRQQLLKDPRPWSWAHSAIDIPRIVEYAPSVGKFAQVTYTESFFEEWREYLNNNKYPEQQADEDGYLEGNARIVIWKAVEQLIQTNAFENLQVTSPFRLGYQIHDDELVILRIINWPHLE